MDFFKEWSFCVCITLVTAVIFSLFSPQGIMKQFYKVIISLFVFISFIYPLKDFSASDIKLDSLSVITELSDNTNSGYENQINAMIKSFLKDKGIVGANVSSSVSVDSENSQIEIKQVTVSIPDEYNCDDVSNMIFEEYGINAKVVYLGG